MNKIKWLFLLSLFGCETTTSSLKPIAIEETFCPKVKIINYSKFKIDDEDMQNLVHADNRCSKLYKDSPCLVEFRKLGRLNYKAICGKIIKKKVFITGGEEDE